MVHRVMLAVGHVPRAGGLFFCGGVLVIEVGDLGKAA